MRALDHVCLVCASSLQVWDYRFVYDILCFLGVYWCVCLFICLFVCGYMTTDLKLHNFRGSSSSVGHGMYPFACVYIGMTYQSVNIRPQT